MESRLPFVLNQFHLPKNRCNGLKLVSNFCLRHSVRENTTNFSDVPLTPESFFAETFQKVVFHVRSNQIFWNLLKMVNHPPE